LLDVAEDQHALHLALHTVAMPVMWLSGTAAGWWNLMPGRPIIGVIKAVLKNAPSSLVRVRRLLKKFTMAPIEMTDSVWPCEHCNANASVLALDCSLFRTD